GDVTAEIRPDAPLLIRADGEPATIGSCANTQALEAQQGAPQVLRPDRIDGDLAVGNCGEPDETADLDVIRTDRVPGADQWPTAFDSVDVGTDPFDLSTHGDENSGEILHVRLARGVSQHRPTLGHDRRHEGVLGAGDARLIEEDVAAD